MNIQKLFPGYPDEIEITGISVNSKDIQEGNLFLCKKGVKIDRHDFIEEAVNNGAAFLVTAREVKTSVPYIVVEDPNAIEEDLYRNFYGDPQDELKIIGVTGTDGKTSTTTMIQTLIGKEKCGYIGTNGYACAAFKRDTSNTTPGVDKLYQYFREFLDAGCKYVAMEASSEAFYYGRLKNITFDTSAITNIDSEHLNTHKTLENYVSCKKQLFLQTENCSILNSHDVHYEECREAAQKPLTYGYREEDDLYIKGFEIHPDHTDITWICKGEIINFRSPLLGAFNVENLSAALLVCLSMGFELDVLLENAKKIVIDGRMQAIDLGQNFYCIVDYAHTPNGLRRLFEFTNTLSVGRIIPVMGQAGERDPYKRKTVGELLVKNCDHVIMTYEDPRGEDINKILDDMCENIRDYDNYERIPDRHEAIKHAIDIAEKDDLVLILGKGNETYEKLKDGTIYFNDVEEAEKAIKEKLGK